jgi:hypothetical protein
MREGRCDPGSGAEKGKHNVKLQWKVIRPASPPPRVSSGRSIARVVGRVRLQTTYVVRVVSVRGCSSERAGSKQVRDKRSNVDEECLRAAGSCGLNGQTTVRYTQRVGFCLSSSPRSLTGSVMVVFACICWTGMHLCRDALLLRRRLSSSLPRLPASSMHELYADPAPVLSGTLL